MLPDIQTFSDLLAIDTSSGLLVEVRLKSNGNINYEFRVNNDLVEGELWTKHYSLTTPLKFSCLISDYTPDHSGVDIVSVTINDIEILPLYAGRAQPPVNYLNFQGLWEFKIDQPFYPWYHEITGQGWIA